MFEAVELASGRRARVYAVHKSGSRDTDTKFLIHDGRAWRWLMASAFTPAPAGAPSEAAPAEPARRSHASAARSG